MFEARRKALIAEAFGCLAKADKTIAKLDENYLKRLHPNCAVVSNPNYQKMADLKLEDKVAVGKKLREITNLPWKYKNGSAYFELDIDKDNQEKLDSMLQAEKFVEAVHVTCHPSTATYRTHEVNYEKLMQLTQAMFPKPQACAKPSL